VPEADIGAKTPRKHYRRELDIGHVRGPVLRRRGAGRVPRRAQCRVSTDQAMCAPIHRWPR
jgi:hypothetical protein